jgi:hypothetical protein
VADEVRLCSTARRRTLANPMCRCCGGRGQTLDQGLTAHLTFTTPPRVAQAPVRGVRCLTSRASLVGGLRTGARAGSRARLRGAAGSRFGRRRSSRSRTRAGFESSSGRPPGGGLGGVGGRRGGPPPPSFESGSERPGDETKRPISAATSRAAANPNKPTKPASPPFREPARRASEDSTANRSNPPT